MELECGDCGPQQVAATTVQVHRNPRTGFAIYAFTCPSCAELVAGGNPQTVQRLLAAGAHQYELRSPEAPPLCPDDVLDFHLLLEREGMLERWLSDPAGQTEP